MDNKEIEVRFLEINKDFIIKKLLEVGAVDKGESLLREVIFYDQNLSWLNEGRFVRLRTSDNTTKLTYKHNKNQTIDSAYEVELDVDSPEEVTKFLEGIGLIEYRHQEKKRHSFIKNNIIIDIDTWPKVPTYVEFEGPSEKLLKEFVNLIGLDWSSAVFDDTKNILEKRYNIPMGKLRWFTFNRFE